MARVRIMAVERFALVYVVWLWGPNSFLSNEYWGAISLGLSEEVKLNSHLHLVLS
jgi:hypothetical protein